MTERNLQRWSREVAEDPGAAAFIRLARAYRREGRREAAREVVLAGLQRNPEHVEAHGLLALLHVEEREHVQARDEWETVLRLDPGNFDASRGLGFLALERGDLGEARRHLGQAARVRPQDPAVRQAREILERRAGAAESAAGAAEPATGATEPAGAATEPPARATAPPAPRLRTRAADPVRLFDPLEGEGPFLGGLLLDEQGLVVAGRLDLGGGEGELLVGLLSDVVEEARRATGLIRLGEWEAMLLDCERITLHVAPVAAGLTLVVAARPGAPTGWVVRVAVEAAQLARRFEEVSA